MASFCKSCLANNVNTRTEWRINPEGKNRPFDIDKNEWHKCPYWKPDPNYRRKQGEFPPELQKEFAATLNQETEKLPNIVSGKDIEERLNKRLDRIEELLEATLKTLGLFKKGNEA